MSESQWLQTQFFFYHIFSFAFILLAYNKHKLTKRLTLTKKIPNLSNPMSNQNQTFLNFLAHWQIWMCMKEMIISQHIINCFHHSIYSPLLVSFLDSRDLSSFSAKPVCFWTDLRTALHPLSTSGLSEWMHTYILTRAAGSPYSLLWNRLLFWVRKNSNCILSVTHLPFPLIRLPVHFVASF